MTENSPTMQQLAGHLYSPRRRAAAVPRVIVLVLMLLGVGLGAFFIGRANPAATNAGSGGPQHAEHADSAAATQWTCSMHPQVVQSEPGLCPICHMELTPLNPQGVEADGGIRIDPVVVQNMGVRLAEVTQGPIVQSVRVVGYLEEPEPLHRDINLRVSGWIEKLHANIDGMPIVKDQPLFDLYSPELMVAIDELIAAQRQAARASDETTAQRLFDSSRRKLGQLGLTPQQIDQLAQAESAPATVPILAPMDGHLTAKMVYEGAAVKAGDLVMRLASRHQMWIDAQVPEAQMPLISDGQPVRATLVSQPGKTFTGKVLFVHPHLDPQTRTALVRIAIDNQDLSLRQGMYATVEILADAYREAPLIPREAVIDTGRRQLVFVSLGEGRFAPRDVTLGLPGQEGMVEVVKGLNPQDQVVVSGQFLLDSESRLREAIAKQLDGGLPGHQHGSASAPPSAPATPPQAEKIRVPHAHDILRAYLTLAEALGARQESETPVDPQPLLGAATMAAQHGQGEGRALAERIVDAAGGLADQPLAKQREAFVALSDSVIQLARRAEGSGDAPQTLFVLHCPMAFSDKGAQWLQDHETVENPFYATQMKRCGEVRERIEPAP